MAHALESLTAILMAGGDLDPAAAVAAAHAMSDEFVPDACKEAFLLALSRKGETAEEVLGFARTYRSLARLVDFGAWPATGIDIVGTGGDRSGSFNISTARCDLLCYYYNQISVSSHYM
jgi:anthranilate phosphoribosyltransferase